MMNSTNNGVMFNGMQGPLMTGTWTNPKTGDSFTVRDCYFEDNQLMVQTTDGRFLNYNQVQNYIQAQGNPKEQTKLAQAVKSEHKDDLPPEVSSLIDDDNLDILPEDLDLISGNHIQTPVSLGNLNTPKSIAANPVNQNLMIIEKALSKCPMPTFDITISWGDTFPKQQIELLNNIMDISMEEIISYYINNLDAQTIAKMIGYELAEDIAEKMKPEIKKESKPINTAVSAKEPVKKTPVKKTTTKKTKE